MIRGFIGKGQLQIGKDIRVKLQTSPSAQLNFKGTENRLRLGEICNPLLGGEEICLGLGVDYLPCKPAFR